MAGARIRLILASYLFATVLVLAGCSGKTSDSEPTSDAGPSTGGLSGEVQITSGEEASADAEVAPEEASDHDGHAHEEDHDHDHDAGDHDHADHDHGEEDDTAMEEDHADHDHAGHSHEAPRGGTLVALGDHFAHLEVLLDADSGKLSFYAMDGHVENPVRLTHQSIPINVTLPDGTEYEFTLAGRVNPLTGETQGDTSEFNVTHEALKGAEHFEVVIPTLTIRGTDFTQVAFSFPDGNE